MKMKLSHANYWSTFVPRSEKESRVDKIITKQICFSIVLPEIIALDDISDPTWNLNWWKAPKDLNGRVIHIVRHKRVCLLNISANLIMLSALKVTVVHSSLI